MTPDPRSLFHQSASPLTRSKAMEVDFQKVRDAIMTGAADLHQGVSVAEREVGALRRRSERLRGALLAISSGHPDPQGLARRTLEEEHADG